MSAYAKHRGNKLSVVHAVAVCAGLNSAVQVYVVYMGTYFCLSNSLLFTTVVLRPPDWLTLAWVWILINTLCHGKRNNLLIIQMYSCSRKHFDLCHYLCSQICFLSEVCKYLSDEFGLSHAVCGVELLPQKLFM